MEDYPTQPDHELLPTDGQRAVAANLVHAAETGGEAALAEYLDGVLGDTEGQLDPAERHAAVRFLGHEQQTATADKVVAAGQKMLGDVRDTTRTTGASLEQTAPTMRRATGSIMQAQQTVGNAVRSGNRAAARAQEGVMHTVRRSEEAAKQHSGIIDTWALSVGTSTQRFEQETTPFKQHLRAVKEAVTTTAPDYDGEPKDLTGLIDDEVKQKTVEKIIDTIARAQSEGIDAEATLAETLQASDTTPNPALQLARRLDSYVEQAPIQAKRVASRTRSDLSEANRQLVATTRRGLDEYPSARSADALVELYRQQRSMLERGVQILDGATRNVPRALQTFDQELHGLQQATGQVRATNEA